MLLLLKTFKLFTQQQTGEVEFQPGHWIGVRYDEPVGKNDGRSVKNLFFPTF